MISSIDYLDNDVSELLGKYIKTRKKNNVVLNELKDNINFTSHINYYGKYFATQTSYRSYPPHSRHYNIKDLLNNITSL